MKILKFILPVFVLGLQAQANEVATFECHSTLQYKTEDYNLPRGQVLVKEVPMTVWGAVGDQGNLIGPIDVQVGEISETFRGYSGYVSHNTVMVSGKKNRYEFSLKYMGIDSPQNWASAAYLSGSTQIRALSEVLVGPEAGRNFPVTCTFKNTF